MKRVSFAEWQGIENVIEKLRKRIHEVELVNDALLKHMNIRYEPVGLGGWVMEAKLIPLCKECGK